MNRAMGLSIVRLRETMRVWATNQRVSFAQRRAGLVGRVRGERVVRCMASAGRRWNVCRMCKQCSSR